MGLFFFTSENLLLGLMLTMLASIGFWGSVVFYNAFLPEIAYPEQQDKASAQGFSMGYLGASLLLIFILVMITFHEQFGIESAGMATRISFLLVGIWWVGFAQLTLRRLPDKVYFEERDDEVLPTGYRAIRRVFLRVRSERGLSNFLLYFFCVSVGVQTIIYVASLFGDKVLHLSSDKLIITILIIQFLGIAGSYLFAFLSGKMGNFKALILAAFIWFVIAMSAGLMNGEASYAERLFYFLAAMVGMVLGGIQALSRSTYSKMIPKEATEHAGYFSFYDVTEKVAIVFGTFLYGFVESLTGSMQNSALALGVFFLVGIVVLWKQRATQSLHTDPA
jgi:UMF1 family MFS transporter